MERTSISKFDRSVLDSIIKHPAMASKNAWWLFTVFFWNNLREECYHVLYEDEDPDLIPDYKEFSIDNMKIEKDVLDIMLKCSAEDFINAMENNLTIRIGGKPYRIPRNENVTKEKLVNSIFKFPEIYEGNKCHIHRNFVFEVRDIDPEGYDRTTDIRESRKFFHKLVYMAESSDDGWYDLTDMEAAAYTWALFMRRYEEEYVKSVIEPVRKALNKIYKECGIETLAELSSCWVDEIESAKVSVDTQFSASKIRRWNEQNAQESFVDKVDLEAAEDYWYKDCKTFKV